MSKPEEHSGEKVPIWIISFADMITLLLSFFVMLQTMAKSRDATLFGVSQDSFRRTIAGLGVPDLLFGKQTKGPAYDYRKLKYPTEENVEEVPQQRVIDADDEKIRQLFEEIGQQVKTRTSDRSEQLLHATAAPLEFSGGLSFDEKSREYLANLAGTIRQNRTPRSTRIYLIAMMNEASPAKETWLLEARRAAAAGAELQKQLSGEGKSQWPISTWAAPRSRGMSESFGQSSSKCNYLVVIMGADHGRGS